MKQNRTKTLSTLLNKTENHKLNYTFYSLIILTQPIKWLPLQGIFMATNA